MSAGIWHKCVQEFLDKYSGQNRKLWEHVLKQSEENAKKSGITDADMDTMIESFPGLLAAQINVGQVLLTIAGSGSGYDAFTEVKDE